MKVGFISFHTFVNPGGVKNHILGLAEEYEKKGIETKILVPRRKLGENYGEKVILNGVSLPFNVGGTQGDICMNFNLFSLYNVLKKEKFDVLHFHNFVIPSAWQILEWQHLINDKAVNVLTFHANLDGMPIFRKNPYFTNLFIKRMEKNMDGVIGVANLTLEPFRSYSGITQVIPNGVNLKEFNPEETVGYKKFEDGKINILFIGRLEERKGLIYLLEAYKLLQEKHDNLRLIIVGDGPLRQECENFVKFNELKNVVFEGQKVGSNVIPRYLKSCHIFCSPAIFGESFGIVLLEGMAMGKPICGFSNLGYKELLKGTMGQDFLAEPRDSKALAEILDRLVKDKGLREEMGKWGLEKVKEYSWEKVAERVLAFYEKCRQSKLTKE